MMQLTGILIGVIIILFSSWSFRKKNMKKVDELYLQSSEMTKRADTLEEEKKLLTDELSALKNKKDEDVDRLLALIKASEAQLISRAGLPIEDIVAGKYLDQKTVARIFNHGMLIGRLEAMK